MAVLMVVLVPPGQDIMVPVDNYLYECVSFRTRLPPLLLGMDNLMDRELYYTSTSVQTPALSLWTWSMFAGRTQLVHTTISDKVQKDSSSELTIDVAGGRS